ncbi:MAG: transcriptional repressor [Chloroflexota bacterium]|nr:transcriptional repressor [Chloroflexota bacterium]
MTDHINRIEKIIAKIRRQGRRITPQRMAILKVLIGNPEHPTVEQIHAEVKKVFPMTSLATTYKMVNLLKEMGEIIEIGRCNDKVHYDGVKSDPHPHLICTQCHSIVDLDIPALGKLPQEIAQSSGYKIMSYQFDFLGICPKCQEKSE